MPTFSERNGFTPMTQAVQIESLDEDTRRQIWNIVQPLENRLMMGSYEINSQRIVEEHLYTEHFGEYLGDHADVGAVVWDRSRATVLSGEWHLVFDYLESLIEGISRSGGVHGGFTDPAVTSGLNRVFERTLADYRVIEGNIVQIGSVVEAEAVTEAATSETVLKAARDHIRRATAALADRTSQDYVSVIRESILAAESLARHLTGKSTLGAAVTELKRSRPDLHPALTEGWKSIYGWTCDEGGIRHGGDMVANPSLSLARWMLVSCSAFITYLSGDIESFLSPRV
ncbi:AbiJ-NTD4 domain-containing protein [Cryobacterium sp. PAMC25264]|uniref:AbiJ-NTD4 domain-containing protein n=1 Tax=Cryobacterium sp. PAMC25264 TaxID=2861288 RepID=UPI001C625486|nr:hypothetical protein [Cryobacterium sp. PAMC25264]QYF74883.1 hypothetical protein KY500_07040 [Cryobacterium sp. PAMC25264]